MDRRLKMNDINFNNRYKDEEGRIIIYDINDIPKNMTEAEEHEFWKNHSMSEELMEASIKEDDALPPPKRSSFTKQISIRIETDLLKRLQKIASIKGIPYQTLLKQFITERVYEEEKRENVF